MFIFSRNRNILTLLLQVKENVSLILPSLGEDSLFCKLLFWSEL